jgi:ABC-type bacteriocin/lantibiotic exporter with double-glycine peptidase domain
MINLHNTRQSFDYDCGVKAIQTLMAYYGVYTREDDLIRELGAGKHGTEVEKIIATAQSRGFTVKAKEHMKISELKKYIDDGIPVLVVLQAWADRFMTIADWQTDFEDGHYAIVIGYVGKVLIFEDPASFRRTWLKEHEFMARWHDTSYDRSHKYIQFGMVVLGKEPVKLIPEHMD